MTTSLEMRSFISAHGLRWVVLVECIAVEGEKRREKRRMIEVEEAFPSGKRLPKVLEKSISEADFQPKRVACLSADGNSALEIFTEAV